jgi:hypothetical protein
MFKSKIVLIFVITVLLISSYIGYNYYEKFQIVECSTMTNCKSCANSFGCLWCAKSKKCVSDLSNNLLCSGESTIADPLGCDITHDTEDTTLKSDFSSPLYGGQCNNNKDCNTCLSSPDCFWCSTNNICTSSIDVYNKCLNDPNIYNSIEQCILKPNLKPKMPDTQSVIPVIGLSRNIDGSLSQTSLKIIFDSFGSRGYPIVDLNSKNKALEEIDKEISFYESLTESKLTKNHIMDLEKVSGYIEGITLNKYTESYQDYKYENEKEKNASANSMLQMIMFLDLIALGYIFYFIRR